MPVNIVCDGCGKELRPLLWRRGDNAGISAFEANVTFARTPIGAIVVACSDLCREFINMGQGQQPA